MGERRGEVLWEEKGRLDEVRRSADEARDAQMKDGMGGGTEGGIGGRMGGHKFMCTKSILPPRSHVLKHQ